MFGKKKKVEEKKEEIVEETKVIETGKKAVDKVDIKLTPEQEKTKDNAEYFMQNYNMALFGPEDFGINPLPYTHNLLFAIYSELKELRKDLKSWKDEQN